MYTITEYNRITIQNFATTTGVAPRALRYPIWVPWDQNFDLEIFLILSPDDVY